jgi:hypothetical protein
LEKLHIALFVASVFSAYRWGDWRNWEKYYSTILFFGLLDLAQNCVYHSMPLWTYTCTIGIRLPHTLISLFWVLIIYPATILIYIYLFPKTLKKQVIYVGLWVIGYILMELMLCLTKGIEYHNNWSIWSSVLFNCGMFTILWVHYKKPVIAWVLTISMFLVFLSFYPIPLKIIK